MANRVSVKTRLNKKGKPSIIMWQGLLYGSSRVNRFWVFAVLAVAIASLSFMQFGFVGVGVQGGFAAYGVALLAPIALSALLLGVWPGTLMGLIAGGVLYLHARYQPLDYFEVNFVTPVASIALFTITAFFLGLLLAIALRKDPPLWRRIVYMGIVFFFVSNMFSMTFMLNVMTQIVFQLADMMSVAGTEFDGDTVNRYAFMAANQMGDLALQVLFDTVLVFVTCVVGDLVVRRILAAQGDFSLRTKFRGWLLVVVSTAFLVTAGFSFAVITEQTKDSVKASLDGEVDYFISQLRTYDERLDVLSSIMERERASSVDLTDDAAAELSELLSIDGLMSGYEKEVEGSIVIIKGDVIVLSDDPEYEVGSSASDYIGNDELQAVLAGADINPPNMIQATYDERILTRKEMGDQSVFEADEITTQIVFMDFGRYNDYTIMTIMPATKAFAGRNATMAWITLSAFVLLLVVFALVSYLLGRIVVRGIDETNGVLGEITGGNLDAQVNIRDSREFASLSEGINTTVGALKDSIAEAESRMDAELATAKEIQESALPQVFPPYPDILKFDVYATMSTAKEVGGDFYDFFLIGDDASPERGKLGFVIADVSGKGIPAALFMMKAKTQLRDYLMSGMEPGEAVENANRQLCDGNEAGMFVTAWIGVLDYATGRVEYVNAGHNPPLLWSFADGAAVSEDTGAAGDNGADGAAESGSAGHAGAADGMAAGSPGRLQGGSWSWLAQKSGLPLGLFEGFPYETYSIECRAGEQFLLYTDGVTEAMDVNGQLYGEDRLLAMANRDFDLHPRALVEEVRRDVSGYAAGAEQSDDITILALEVGVPPELTATLVVSADVDELPRVNDFIHTELDRRLCPVRAQKQLDIAVEELFVNVAHYAYPEATPDDPGTVRISYTYSTDPPSVQVDIADGGVPYDPLAKPDAVTPDDIADVPIGGLGILMAKRSVDDMTYERVGENNVVSIVKKW